MPKKEPLEPTTAEQTGENTVGESDPLDVTAADLYQTPDEDGQEPEPEREAETVEGDTGDETDEDDESEPEPEDAESEAGDDDDLDVPRLAEDIEGVLKEHNPKLVERWEKQWKGILKREKAVEGLETIDKTIGSMFGSVETARQELDGFLKGLSEHHGVTVAELVGLRAPDEQEPGDDLESLVADENLYEGELALKRKFERDLAAMRAEFAKELEPMRAERTEKEQRAKEQAYVERIAPRTIKAIEKTYPGFKVTNDQIIQALKKFPQLKDSPIEAVEACYARQIAQHSATLAQRHAGRGREGAPSREAKGRDLPKDPTELTAADIYQHLGS